MAQWPAGDFLDSLKAALDARAGLDGVTVWTAMPGPDVDLSSSIVLGHKPITGSTPWAALGQSRRNDDITISCLIRVLRAGAGETVMAAVRQRVEAIVVELIAGIAGLPEPSGTQILMTDDINYSFDQYAAEHGTSPARGADLEITFTARFRVT